MQSYQPILCYRLLSRLKPTTWLLKLLSLHNNERVMALEVCAEREHKCLVNRITLSPLKAAKQSSQDTTFADRFVGRLSVTSHFAWKSEPAVVLGILHSKSVNFNTGELRSLSCIFVSYKSQKGNSWTPVPCIAAMSLETSTAITTLALFMSFDGNL
jgi:hypothetical protein